jgi:RNA processing factor Prp31
MMSDSLEEISPNVLKLFSSRLEMEEAVQSRFLAVAPALRDTVGALDPATLAVALELAVILFLPMAMRKLLKQ